ncbi:NAD(P)-binding Rossmann-fold containing protein [Glarea lozoyensis ATCC 20868]|uniref:NAD(P)-binding Rossmann-fold containing protein n=2 Tax=Glarea lozoyensis TaxID=101852 RepID=S3DKB5_GLAL2|nr:NAD(P)-binding Rossmann-fold containing protein [Glarea lozoyensis ATCC 20868]EHL00649.1 putative Uncharacterized oxidoreductase yesF [Glarea lozoyensis 74030]EPE26993.1 NAD(P)-binding Rossmann-fold containing protein [Glarea lozoyensis ATCC 20868]
MAILITGGTGKTASRIAKYCLDSKIPFLVASRKGQSISSESYPAVDFDWTNSATFRNPFQYKFPNGEGIDKVYLVGPDTADPISEMAPFIDLAKEQGVKKFIYFIGSSAELGGHYVGKVWKKLAESEIEYTVLRATWLMDNFLSWQHGATIKNENKIYSACGDGQIPFISANDIARMGFFLLTDPKPHETNYRVLGPEPLTFDQVAEKLSQGIGRTIQHVKISEQESCERLVNFGMSEYLSRFLAKIEVGTANGAENFIGNDVEKVTGKAPETFEAWVADNKGAFEK